MRRTCARCGAAADAPPDGLPEGWSMGTGERGVELCCDSCTRGNIRAIEAKLPEEYWDA